VRNAKHLSFALVLAAGASAAAGVPANAGETVSFNYRRMMAVSVLPAPSGAQELRAVFCVRAPATSEPLDVSTRVEFRVNGTLVDAREFALTAGGTRAGCSTDCAELGQSCVCLEGTSICGCREVYLVATATPVPINAKDLIEVIIMPPPGAVPDDDEGDNALSLTFDGAPVFWDRSIAAVDVRPSATAGLFDIEVTLAARSLYSGDLDLSGEIDVSVNGEPVSHGTPAGGTIGVNPCQGGCLSYCAFDVDRRPVGICDIVAEETFTCECFVYRFASATIPAVPASAKDLIEVLLRPAPGALPELPGFEENDRWSAAAPDLESPHFALGFAAVPGGRVDVPAEEVFRATVDLTLATSNNPDPDSGARGWAVGVEASGARIVAVTTDGTDAGRLLSGGFQVNELTSGTGNEGALSVVVLSLTRDVTLPPAGTATIARVTLEGRAPPAGDCRPVFLRYENGLLGSGQPVDCVVSWGNESVAPSLGRTAVDICGRRRNWLSYDCNGDGGFDMTDAICDLNYQFLGGTPPGCHGAMDFNGDRRRDIADAVSALTHLFLGGPPPSAGLGCQVYVECGESPSCL
jgi:hypothetical protein